MVNTRHYDYNEILHAVTAMTFAFFLVGVLILVLYEAVFSNVLSSRANVGFFL